MTETKKPFDVKGSVEKIGLPSAPLKMNLSPHEKQKSNALALPLVEKIGLEPTTSWLPAKRSSQLSYIPNFLFHSAQDQNRNRA